MAELRAVLPDRLEEVELTGKAVAAVTRFSRDEGHAVRLASARAAGHLALAELRLQLPQDAALAPLLPVMVALIGTDQSSEVQRQMLLVGCPVSTCAWPFVVGRLPVSGRLSGLYHMQKVGRALIARCLMQVLRKVAVESADALVPHYTSLIPSLVSLLQQTQGPTKLAGDRTLGRVLQVTALSPCKRQPFSCVI